MSEAVPEEMVAQLRPEAIAQERRARWIHFHPEHFCHRCSRRNIRSWYVSSELWNQAVARTTEILCPVCFVEFWEQATGQSVTWELRIDPQTLKAGISGGAMAEDYGR